MSEKLTDTEVICAWMEPQGNTAAEPRPFWWCWAGGKRMCRSLTLDALWQVEERLTEELWEQYESEMLALWRPDLAWGGEVKHYLHATPEQKIKALAGVLRPIVEAR